MIDPLQHTLKRNKYSKLLWVLAIVTIICYEFGFATLQYHHTKIDGDFAGIVLPNEWYARVLKDPLGIDALLKQEKYQATNRFTTHYVMRTYFYHVPLLLQKIVDPIESVFLSITIAKLFIHFLFLSVIGLYISILCGFSWRNWILGSIIISPLLIAHGPFEYYMVFMDTTITYAMFYALPIAVLLIYYLPIFLITALKKRKATLFLVILYLPISLLMVLFGPLSAPLILLTNLLILLFITLNFLIQNRINSAWRNVVAFLKKEKLLILLLSTGLLTSLYSLYIGQFNNENDVCIVPIPQRYEGLIIGMKSAFLNYKEGILPVLIIIALNFIVLHFNKKSSARNYLLLVSVIFILLYCILLPLGGCREYRPYILRRDTFLPILAILLILTGYSTLQLFQTVKRRKAVIIILWLLVAYYYWRYDQMPPNYNDNVREKMNLYQLSKSKEECTILEEDMSIMGWSNFNDCSQSRINSQLIYHYRITDTVRYYKNKEQSQ
jgi:hypothetical protein